MKKERNVVKREYKLLKDAGNDPNPALLDGKLWHVDFSNYCKYGDMGRDWCSFAWELKDANEMAKIRLNLRCPDEAYGVKFNPKVPFNEQFFPNGGGYVLTCSVKEVELTDRSLLFENVYYNSYYEPKACLAILKKAGFNIDRIPDRHEDFGDLMLHCLHTISKSNLPRQEKIDTVNQALDDFVNGRYIKRFKNKEENDDDDDDDDDDDEEEEEEEDDEDDDDDDEDNDDEDNGNKEDHDSDVVKKRKLDSDSEDN